MVIKVQKWGNSLAIRIPKAFREETYLSTGSLVDLSVEDNKLIIKPLKKKYTLEELLLKIDKNNLHKDEFSSNPIGKELL